MAFARPDLAAWPAGTYRIVVRYWNSEYRLAELSWHLDVGVDPDEYTPVPWSSATAR